MRTGIVVQARMGSTRLPGKVLRPIAGRPLLGHVIGRLGALRHDALPVVATTLELQDDAVAGYCAKFDVACFRGSEHDVLDRYVACARFYAFDQIVRLTADNPFTDIDELDRLIEMHLAGSYDYSHSFGMMPVGVGAEIFTRAALERSAGEGEAPHHREHVNEYVQENPLSFRIGRLDVDAAKRRPEISLTVDTEEDYLRACRIADRAPERFLSTLEAIAA